MLTNIPIDGYPKGITLYTIAPPSLEHMRDAVARFHDFPLLNGSPFVVLGNPADFSPLDRIWMRRIGIRGYENIDEEGNTPLTTNNDNIPIVIKISGGTFTVINGIWIKHIII